MVQFNLLVTALAALIPLLVGMIWYNPKVFGTAWMKSTGLSEEQLRNVNMLKVYGLTYVLSFLMAFALNFFVIHQFHFISTLMNEPGLMDKGTEMNNYAMDFFKKYGHNFRTFKHGMLHGFMAGVMLALPIVGITSLFERKSGKYIWIHAGFYIVCMMLMGGVICQFV